MELSTVYTILVTIVAIAAVYGIMRSIHRRVRNWLFEQFVPRKDFRLDSTRQDAKIADIHRLGALNRENCLQLMGAVNQINKEALKEYTKGLTPDEIATFGQVVKQHKELRKEEEEAGKQYKRTKKYYQELESAEVDLKINDIEIKE